MSATQIPVYLEPVKLLKGAIIINVIAPQNVRGTNVNILMMTPMNTSRVSLCTKHQHTNVLGYVKTAINMTFFFELNVFSQHVTTMTVLHLLLMNSVM